MDYHGLQARLSDLKTAEVAALRRGDKEAAQRCAEKRFVLRQQYTDYQAALETGTYDSEAFQSQEGEESECRENVVEEETRGAENSGDEKKKYCRKRKKCPIPGCGLEVVHLPRHLMSQKHKYKKKYAKIVNERFGLRKKYAFKNEETATAGNRKKRKAKGESKQAPLRKKKKCPMRECFLTTDRLPQHLRVKHQLTPDDPKFKAAMSEAVVVDGDKTHIFHVLNKQIEERKQRVENVNSSAKIGDASNEEAKVKISLLNDIDADDDIEFDDSDVSNDFGATDDGDCHDDDDEDADYIDDKDDDNPDESLVDIDDDLPSENNIEPKSGAADIMKDFRKWLLSPDGGMKDPKTAKQHVAQTKKILVTVDPEEHKIDSLFDVKLIRDVFLAHAAEKYHATTIKSYLMSLQHFCSFVMSEEPNQLIIEKEILIKIREKLKRWSSSYSRKTAKRRWEKMEEDVNALITPEMINDFEMSKASRDAIVLLGQHIDGKAMLFTQARYVLVRDFLIAQIMLDNAHRAGVTVHMTIGELGRATFEDDRYVVKVLNHKTLETEGPAIIVLTRNLFSYLSIFISEMRSRLPNASDDSKSPVFLSWSGKALASSQMSKILKSIFKKAGVDGHVHHTLYRKSSVTKVHKDHKEMSGDLAQLMAHKESTAQKYYRIHDKTSTSVKASQQLREIMRTPRPDSTKKDKELSSSPDDENDMTAECHRNRLEKDTESKISRSSWNQESLDAIRSLFKEEIAGKAITIDQVRSKIKDIPILAKEDAKRIYDKVRGEWRFQTGHSPRASSARLPQEKEELETKVKRLFRSEDGEESDESDDSAPSNVIPPTISRASSRPNSVFEDHQVLTLLRLCKDMTFSAPISKPVITERLSKDKEGAEVLNRIHINQIVSRLKYERKRKQIIQSLSAINKKSR